MTVQHILLLIRAHTYIKQVTPPQLITIQFLREFFFTLIHSTLNLQRIKIKQNVIKIAILLIQFQQ